MFAILFLITFLCANAKTIRHDVARCTGLVQAPEGVHLRPQLCNLLKQYEKTHQQTIESLETVNNNKFILLNLDEYEGLGLGNRLPDVVAGFVLSMFLNRTFLYSLPKASEETFQDILGFHYRTSGYFENNTELTTAPISSNFFNILDTKFWETSESADVMYFPISWGANWLANFQANPHLLPFLEQYFPDYEIFHPLSQYMFHLSDNAQQLVDQSQANHFRPLTIGLQIRMLKMEWSKWGAAYGMPKLDDYFTLAKLLQITSGVPESNTTFFIAGDKPEVYEAAAAALPGHVFHTDNGVGKEYTSRSHINPGSELYATVDMKLLSMCDVLIVTWGSSYGSVAAGWGGIKAHMLTGRELFDDALPWFFVQSSTEPCHWPANDMTIHHLEWPAFQRNPLWMHHTQCNPCIARKRCRNPQGNKVKAEKVNFVRNILLNSSWEATTGSRRH